MQHSLKTYQCEDPRARIVLARRCLYVFIHVLLKLVILSNRQKLLKRTMRALESTKIHNNGRI